MVQSTSSARDDFCFFSSNGMEEVYKDGYFKGILDSVCNIPFLS